MSNKPTGQKQAVVDAVSSVLGSNFQPGSTVVKDVLSASELETVRNQIFDGIKNGNIQYNGETSDDKKLRRYVNGMIQNHFRKAKELNGGSKYKPANPGTGRRDPQLSNLKKLLKQYDENSPEFQKVTEAIATREAEISEEKKAAAAARKQEKLASSIDTSVLPPELANAIEAGSNA